jgi:hypothetical protein
MWRPGTSWNWRLPIRLEPKISSNRNALRPGHGAAKIFSLNRNDLHLNYCFEQFGYVRVRT